ncbi:MAG: hypothetical protein DI570_09515 [Phenylobacterium zucineum]|nr:MAG: hypothetical protein DI570_09515 [Phenylobacterium zucineum]
MREPRCFAYSLSHDDNVWRWCVYDEEGVTVADGANATQDLAQAAVYSTLRTAGVDLGLQA